MSDVMYARMMNARVRQVTAADAAEICPAQVMNNAMNAHNAQIHAIVVPLVIHAGPCVVLTMNSINRHATVVLLVLGLLRHPITRSFVIKTESEGGILIEIGMAHSVGIVK